MFATVFVLSHHRPSLPPLPILFCYKNPGWGRVEADAWHIVLNLPYASAYGWQVPTMLPTVQALYEYQNQLGPHFPYSVCLMIYDIDIVDKSQTYILNSIYANGFSEP